MEKVKKIIPYNYGSIAHLSTSKLSQQADKKIHSGQEDMLTLKKRDKEDLVIVTEKIDGSNVGVYRDENGFHCLTRAGFEANTSPYEQHQYFMVWVMRHMKMFEWLPMNWRVVGEWCIQVHGTKYDITNESPFVAFDIIDDNHYRIRYNEFMDACEKNKIPTVPILHIGEPISIEEAWKLVGEGHYGKPKKPEGMVYRYENPDRYEFAAKWVREDKIDGLYMKENIHNKGWKESMEK